MKKVTKDSEGIFSDLFYVKRKGTSDDGFGWVRRPGVYLRRW